MGPVPGWARTDHGAGRSSVPERALTRDGGLRPWCRGRAPSILDSPCWPPGRARPRGPSRASAATPSALVCGALLRAAHARRRPGRGAESRGSGIRQGWSRRGRRGRREGCPFRRHTSDSVRHPPIRTAAPAPFVLRPSSACSATSIHITGTYLFCNYITCGSRRETM